MSSGKKRTVSFAAVETAEDGKEKLQVALAQAKPMKQVKRRRPDSATDVKDSGLKVKRQRQVRSIWTATATDAFFEGLSQHGKKFHSILHYMQTKFKKKNDPIIPNLTKNQVRFFYYRTWHKVSNLLSQRQTTDEQKATKVMLEEMDEGKGLQHVEALCEEEGENSLDSSMEEAELGESSPREAGNFDTSSPVVESDLPVLMKGITESPVSDKVESTCKKEALKDTVLLNGVEHSLELVALICYHKLKNKCRGEIDSKKLREMVYDGSTTIRLKGKKKKIQIKIPNCRALRGTKSSICVPDPVDNAVEMVPSESDVCSEVPNVPSHVTLELRPFSLSSWLYVQGKAQNPRLRLTVTTSKSVEDVLKFIALKWHVKDPDTRILLYESEMKSNAEEKHDDALLETSTDVEGKDKDEGFDVIEKPYIDSGVRSTGSFIAKDTGVENVSILDHCCSIGQIYSKQRTCPEKLKLLYNIVRTEEHQEKDSSILGDMLKMVQFIIRNASSTGSSSSTPTQGNSPQNNSAVYSSPKVVEYMHSLRKKSPYKSPYKSPVRMKYLRMANRTTRSQSSARGLPVRKGRLDFSSFKKENESESPKDTSAAVSRGNVKPSTAPSSLVPIVHIVSSSLPSYHMTSPDERHHVVSVQKESLKGCGSFGDIRLKSLFLTAAENLKETSGKDRNQVLENVEAQADLPTCTSASSIDIVDTPSTKQISPLRQVLQNLTPTSPVIVVKPSTKSSCSSVSVPSQPVTASKSLSKTSPVTTPSSGPIVTSLKPFSRIKKLSSKANQPIRQLIPRPLPFLPKAANPLPSSSSALQPKAKDLAAESAKSIIANQAILNALHKMISQHKSYGAVEPQPSTVVTSVASTISTPSCSSAQQTITSRESIPVSEPDIMQAVNLFLNMPSEFPDKLETISEDKPVQTSSDTVNNLLKGLSSQLPNDESLRKLSDETLDVLPSFAMAVLNKSNKNAGDVSQEAAGTSSDCVPSTSSPVKQLGPPIVNENSVAEVLQSLMESRHAFDQSDNTRVFSEFKHPDEQSPFIPLQEDLQQDGDISIGGLLDYINSPEKEKSKPGVESSMDSTYKSLLDEGSVDYIQKFQELASRMNQN